MKDRDLYCNVYADRALKGRTPTTEGDSPSFNQEFELCANDSVNVFASLDPELNEV